MIWLLTIFLSLHVFVSSSITVWPVYVQRLHASNCDDKGCPAPSYRDEYIEYCGYKCPFSDTFICEEDEHMNVIEYCLPVNLICEPGYYVKGKTDPDDETVVILEKLQCPEGTYKQFTNYCIDQCTKQEPEYFLPVMFNLHEKGNFKEPAKVVCDHHKNFFTQTDKLWYYHDKNFTHHYSYYCEEIKDNPCPSGERPLKDGSCVCGILECLPENNTTSGLTSMSSKKQPRSTTSMTTPDIIITGMPNQNTDQTYVVLIVVLIVVFGIVSLVVIGIIIALSVYICLKRRKKEKEEKEENEEKEEEKEEKCVIVNQNNFNGNTTIIHGNMTLARTSQKSSDESSSDYSLLSQIDPDESSRVVLDSRERESLLTDTNNENVSPSNDSEDLIEVISSGSYEDNGSNGNFHKYYFP